MALYNFVKLEGENLARLIGKLKGFAAEYGCRGRGARYVLFGDVLLNEAHLNRDPALTPRILNRHRQIIRFELPFVADRIETQTNARIFGFMDKGGRNATVKVLMRNRGLTFATRRYGNSLFADIRARRLAAPGLARGKRIFAPSIYEYDHKHGGWIVEEFAPGKRVERRDIALFAPLVDGSAIYGGSARLKPVLRQRPTRKWLEWLTAIDPEFPRPESDAVWPEALIHSDLRDNMRCTPDGRLCLIDWELARIGPVASDLASIYYLNPDVKPILLKWLRDLDPQGRALPPEIQIGLSLMRHTSDMANPPRYVADLMKKRRIDHKAATALYEEDKRGVRDFLRFLIA